MALFKTLDCRTSAESSINNRPRFLPLIIFSLLPVFVAVAFVVRHSTISEVLRPKTVTILVEAIGKNFPWMVKKFSDVALLDPFVENQSSKRSDRPSPSCSRRGG